MIVDGVVMKYWSVDMQSSPGKPLRAKVSVTLAAPELADSFREILRRPSITIEFPVKPIRVHDLAPIPALEVWQVKPISYMLAGNRAEFVVEIL